MPGAAAYWPASQIMHVAIPPVEAWPGSHAAQADWPSLSAYLPASHASQSPGPTQALQKPSVHCWHSMASAPAAQSGPVRVPFCPGCACQIVPLHMEASQSAAGPLAALIRRSVTLALLMCQLSVPGPVWAYLGRTCTRPPPPPPPAGLPPPPPLAVIDPAPSVFMVCVASKIDPPAPPPPPPTGVLELITIGALAPAPPLLLMTAPLEKWRNDALTWMTPPPGPPSLCVELLPPPPPLPMFPGSQS